MIKHTQQTLYSQSLFSNHKQSTQPNIFDQATQLISLDCSSIIVQGTSGIIQEGTSIIVQGNNSIYNQNTQQLHRSILNLKSVLPTFTSQFNLFKQEMIEMSYFIVNKLMSVIKYKEMRIQSLQQQLTKSQGLNNIMKRQVIQLKQMISQFMQTYKKQLGIKQIVINNKDKQILLRDKQISNKDKQISNKQKQISNKNKQILHRQKQIGELKNILRMNFNSPRNRCNDCENKIIDMNELDNNNIKLMNEVRQQIQQIDNKNKKQNSYQDNINNNNNLRQQQYGLRINNFLSNYCTNYNHINNNNNINDHNDDNNNNIDNNDNNNNNLLNNDNDNKQYNDRQILIQMSESIVCNSEQINKRKSLQIIQQQSQVNSITDYLLSQRTNQKQFTNKSIQHIIQSVQSLSSNHSSYHQQQQHNNQTQQQQLRIDNNVYERESSSVINELKQIKSVNNNTSEYDNSTIRDNSSRLGRINILISQQLQNKNIYDTFSSRMTNKNYHINTNINNNNTNNNNMNTNNNINPNNMNTNTNMNPNNNMNKNININNNVQQNMNQQNINYVYNNNKINANKNYVHTYNNYVDINDNKNHNYTQTIQRRMSQHIIGQNIIYNNHNNINYHSYSNNQPYFNYYDDLSIQTKYNNIINNNINNISLPKQSFTNTNINNNYIHIQSIPDQIYSQPNQQILNKQFSLKSQLQQLSKSSSCSDINHFGDSQKIYVNLPKQFQTPKNMNFIKKFNHYQTNQLKQPTKNQLKQSNSQYKQQNNSQYKQQNTSQYKSNNNYQYKQDSNQKYKQEKELRLRTQPSPPRNRQRYEYENKQNMNIEYKPKRLQIGRKIFARKKLIKTHAKPYTSRIDSNKQIDQQYKKQINNTKLSTKDNVETTANNQTNNFINNVTNNSDVNDNKQQITRRRMIQIKYIQSPQRQVSKSSHLLKPSIASIFSLNSSSQNIVPRTNTYLQYHSHNNNNNFDHNNNLDHNNKFINNSHKNNSNKNNSHSISNISNISNINQSLVKNHHMYHSTGKTSSNQNNNIHQLTMTPGKSITKNIQRKSISKSKQKLKVTSKSINHQQPHNIISQNSKQKFIQQINQNHFSYINNQSISKLKSKHLSVHIGNNQIHIKQNLYQIKHALSNYNLSKLFNTLKQVYYDGNIINNQKQGQAKIVYDNGIVYQGYLQNGKKQGQSKLTLNGVDLYEGHFVNDKIQGQGYLKFFKYLTNSSYTCPKILQDASYYGRFVNNNFDGMGTLFLNQKQKIVTKFSKGVPYGQLTFYTENDIEFGHWPTD